MRYAYDTPWSSFPSALDSPPQTRIRPRSRYIAHSSSFTHDLSSSRARCSARRSRPGSYGATVPAAIAALRARRSSARRSNQGSVTSASRAITTMAVATRATVIGGWSARPAGGAGEEDHTVGLTRDLLEGADELGLTAPRLALHRNRRPHPLLELSADPREQPLLVLADPDVPLGDQLLAVAGTHAQELHPPIMSRAEARLGGFPRQVTEGHGQHADRQGVHRPCPGADAP